MTSKIMRTNNSILNFLAIFIVGGTAFGVGFWLRGEVIPSENHFPILNQAFEIIQNHGYLDIPDDATMEYGAIYGMINAYGDEHTHFLEPRQTELINDTLAGSYGGIGAQITRDDQGRLVIHPYPDSPAEKGGLLDGDRLIAVDGVAITIETSTEDAIAMVRGPEDEYTRLSISRPPDFIEMEFNIKRTNIPLPSVTYHLDVREPQMGVIKINAIASSTPDEIKDAVMDLQTRGATTYVLDLRGNGGGLLQEGVEIARIFLEDGVVIQHKFRDKDIETFEVNKPGLLAKIPLVVLVDQNTASAAEIISGALQNQGRAQLIGTHTFGKDSIQLVFELDDKSSLHVTSAKWWVPGLEPAVGEGGLVPDISVSTDNSGTTDPYLDAALQYFFGVE